MLGFKSVRSFWNARISSTTSEPLGHIPGPSFSAALLMISIANTNKMGDNPHLQTLPPCCILVDCEMNTKVAVVLHDIVLHFSGTHRNSMANSISTYQTKP